MARTPDILLSALGLASAFYLTACSGEQKGPVVATPLPRAVPTATLAPTVTSPDTDPVKLGQLMRDLDLSGMVGFDLNFGANMSNAKVDILNQSGKYIILVDPRGVDYWTRYCHLENLPSSVDVTFADRISPGQNVVAGFNRVSSFMDIGIDGFYESTDQNLDRLYRFKPEEKAKVLENAVVLWANIRLIDTMCASPGYAELQREGKDSQAGGRLLDQWTKTANSLQVPLLTGQVPLMFDIYPVIKGPTA